MTKFQWERAHTPPSYSDASAWHQANRWLKPAKANRAKAKPLMILRHAAPHLDFANPEARAMVARLLASGLPPNVIAARTGMPSHWVEIIAHPAYREAKPVPQESSLDERAKKGLPTFRR